MNRIIQTVFSPIGAAAIFISTASLMLAFVFQQQPILRENLGPEITFIATNISPIIGIGLPIFYFAIKWRRRRNLQFDKGVIQKINSQFFLENLHQYLVRDGANAISIRRPEVENFIDFVDSKNRARWAGRINYRGFVGQSFQDSLDTKIARNTSFMNQNPYCQLLIKNPSDLTHELLPISGMDTGFRNHSWARPYIGLSAVFPLEQIAFTGYFNADGPDDNSFPPAYIAKPSASSNEKGVDNFLLFTCCLDLVFLRENRKRLAGERLKYTNLMMLSTLFHIYEVIRQHTHKSTITLWAVNESSAVQAMLKLVGFERVPGFKTSDSDAVFRIKVRLEPTSPEI